MSKRRLRSLLPMALAGLVANEAVGAAGVTVDAGPGLPAGYPLAVNLDPGATPPTAIRFTVGDRKETVPVQVDELRRAWFRSPATPAGTRLIGEFLKDTPAGNPLPLRRDGATLQFGAAPAPGVVYQAEPGPLPRPDIREVFRRGGYLHPIRTPSGRGVTDDFPPNHIHHHGVWSPWTKTVFEGRTPDFWNMGDAKGRVDFVAVEATWQGAVQSGFRSHHRFIDMLARPEKAALEETWTVRVYPPVPGTDGPPVQVIDLEIEQRCSGDSPLRLPEYHYGGLGFRGRRDWDGAANCRFLTSEGETDRIRAHATRARWCWVGGGDADTLCGIALLGHPDNFRAPQPVRVHPTEPFFCFAPQQLGEFEITPDRPYRARYRFLVFDGEPDRQRIDRWWTLYAHQPRVHLLD